MRVLRFVALAVLLMPLATLTSSWTNRSDPTRPFNRFLSRATKMLERRHGYQVSATGGSFVGGVSQIILSLNKDHQLGINGARRELITAVEELRKAVATDSQLKPYLAKDPLPIDCFKIFLNLRSCYEDTSTVEFPVALVTLARGSLYYSSWDYPTERFTDIHSETYEEALRIVSGGE